MRVKYVCMIKLLDFNILRETCPGRANRVQFQNTRHIVVKRGYLHELSFKYDYGLRQAGVQFSELIFFFKSNQ